MRTIHSRRSVSLSPLALALLLSACAGGAAPPGKPPEAPPPPAAAAIPLPPSVPLESVPVARRESPARVWLLPPRGFAENQSGAVGRALEALLGLPGGPHALPAGSDWPDPTQPEGAQALKAMGADYVAVVWNEGGMRDGEMGGYLTVELYRPPATHPLWLTTLPLDAATSPEQGLERTLPRLLEHLERHHDRSSFAYAPVPVARREPPHAAPAATPPAPAMADVPYTHEIQVGAFLEEENARHRLAHLTRLGYHPYLLSLVDHQGRTWNAVRIGRYASRDEALAQLRQFVSQAAMEAALVPYGGW